MIEFGLAQRSALIDRLQKETFDVVVVGGGITGAGIARDAALRGLNVALLEKDDFSEGTSSRSSKLVHGGLRYLENYEFGLVFESTQERSRLMRNLAPHVVRPLPFLMPVWKDSKHGLALLDMGLWLYDILGTLRNYKIHSRLGRKELIQKAPGIRENGLVGGLLYYDAISDDTRLTIENVIGTFGAGGVSVSRIMVSGVETAGGRVRALSVRDTFGNREFSVKTKSVIVSAGPWTESVMNSMNVRNGLRLRPTKGTHVVLPYESFPIDHAVVLSTPQDGRVMFVLPWNGATVFGTTDTDYDGPLDSVYATRSDVDYLFESVRHYFPSLRFDYSDVIGTWAGLRPLLSTEGVSESQVSREHEVHIDNRGIITIAGGKLTTYRIMAGEALDAAAPFIGAPVGNSITGHTPLPYARRLSGPQSINSIVSGLKSRHGLDERSARELAMQYGGSAPAVAEHAADPELLKRLHPTLPYLGVQVVHAVRSEMALSLTDVLKRRLPAFFLHPDPDTAFGEKAADLAGSVLGWSAEEKLRQRSAIRSDSALHMECVR